MIYCETIIRTFPIFITKLWFRRYTTDLKAVLKKKIPLEREIVKKFRQSHGQIRMGEVTLDQMYYGMRGIKALIWETSVVDPTHGIRFREHSFTECIENLPRAPGSEQPLPEGLFWLLLTGDIPSENQVSHVSQEWAKRSKIPDETYEVLNILKHLHPLAQLSAAVISLSAESHFKRAHRNNILREVHWEFIYEDVMDLLGKLIVVAALIYRDTFNKDDKKLILPTINNDWSSNFARMLGFESPKFVEFLRLYLTVFADHEGGNVSAHTVHLVGSSLTDPYLSYSAGINGMCGPRHTLANEDIIIWLNDLSTKLGDNYSETNLREYVWNSLSGGNIIPGYGHSVLLETDPRYLVQREFAKKHLPDDKMFKLVSDLYTVVPPILKELSKMANPWPNGFAHSGVILQHFGMTESHYHNILFAVSRAMGVLAQLVWSRALFFPVERVKTFSTKYLMGELRAID